MEKSSKIVELEALRGIAALIVFVEHFFLAFWPYPLVGLWVVSGETAVVFFFVLSGFVLPLKLFDRTRPDGELLAAALRRWPRLALPCLVTTLASAAMISGNLYASRDAGVLSGSPWLVDLFPAQGTALDAATETLFGMFWQSGNRYNIALWTMYYELWGSLLVFGTVAVIRKLSLRAGLVVLAVEYVAVSHFSPYVSAFLTGLVLARLYTGTGYVIRWPASLRGPVAAWLGRLSFPIYLSHLLVIGSLSSALYVRGVSLPLLFAVTTLAVLAASLLLTAFDRWLVIALRVITGSQGWLIPASMSAR